MVGACLELSEEKQGGWCGWSGASKGENGKDEVIV